MSEGIQFISAAVGPDNMQDVRSAVALLNERFPEDKLTGRAGPGGKKLQYVPWDESLRIMNRLFGQVYWGEDNTNDHYEPTSRTYRLTKRIWVAVYDPVGMFIVIFSRAGQGRAVARDDSESAHDLAASAVESDAFSKAVKKLGDAFAAYLYDRADPARQENPTSTGAGRTGNGYATQRGGAQATAQSNGNRRGKPTENQANALRRYKVPESLVARATFDQASRFIGAMKDGAAVDQALGSAGLIEYSGIAAEPGLDDVDDIPF